VATWRGFHGTNRASQRPQLPRHGKPNQIFQINEPDGGGLPV
jgi:hypothetical protein